MLKEWFYIDERHCFDSLSKLLKHYSENPGLAVKLSDTPTFLKPNNKKNKNKNKYSNNSWELPRDKIILDKEPLGAGHFGQVHRGVWTETDKKGNSEKLEVAVKTLIEATNDPDAFTKEAEILTKVKHRNLVRMIGVCAHEKPPLIVTEFCNGGSLIGFLRDSDGQKCSMKKLVKMIGQVATGMSYLETVKIVHRDLAARNVLLTDDRKCKVCDFGLARFLMDNEIYQGSSKSKFPWKWTAPEGLSEQRFSSKSDVWSFGVLCFEMTSRGQGPYKGLERKKIQQMLQNGYRLEQPQECPLWVYLMMRKCWKLDPHERYSFRHIRKIVHKYRNHQEQDNQKIKSTTQLK
ncbi:tyrosine-protein kinase Yes-like [Symsagittifera roscoffensis]|uniref:tyrosine-protein kinase Yes-like n=1 Tax=Symsagittifera roscoffensis TaxID=84072 RepID=UPI00307C6BC2